MYFACAKETESPTGTAAEQLLPTYDKSSATTAQSPTIAPALASPATQPSPLPTHATVRALVALPLLHLHPPNLLQGALPETKTPPLSADTTDLAMERRRSREKTV